MPRWKKERDLDEEFAFHLEGLTREYMARGMDSRQASLAARRDMQGSDRYKEACRDARGISELLNYSWRLIRHAARRLSASPAFTVAAIGTLAVGIGGATAVFSLINGVLLKPLPYRDAGRLVAITQNVSVGGKRRADMPVSAAHARHWREQAQSIERIALAGGDRRFLLREGASPEPVYATNVSVDFFRMIGVTPAVGRDFSPGEDEQGKDSVAILSHQFWSRRFQSDPGILGKPLRLNGGETLTIVGVMPEGFAFLRDLGKIVSLPRQADYWRPFALEPSQFNPAAEFNHTAIARLRPSVTATAAAAEELTRLSEALARPAGLNVSASVVAIPDALWGGVRQPILLLSFAVGAALLICCLNVANLMVARMFARRHEYAVRAALGAGRGRLTLEMLAEAALLAAAGGVLGLAGANLLLAWLPESVALPSAASTAFDWRVGLFAVAVCSAATLLAGGIPALRFSLAQPQDAMRRTGAASGRTVAGSQAANRLRGILAASEVALCAVLLVSAGLLIRSFDQILKSDRGFSSEDALVFDVQLPVDRYSEPAQRLAVWRRLLQQLAAIPGVTSAGAINRLPMSSEMQINGVLAEGAPQRPVFEQPMANYRAATPGYFAAAGIPIHSGRVFTDAEADRAAAVISRNLGERIWPSQNPIGRRFRRNGTGEWFTVVGIAADVRQSSLEAAAPMMVYRGERGTGGLTMVVRTPMAPPAFTNVLRNALVAIDDTIMVDPVRAMDDLVAANTARRRWQTTLVSAFAALATLLAALGIWGVVAYAVSARRSEIGIRMALGAGKAAVTGMVLRQSLHPILAGACIGIAASGVVSRLLESLLYGIRPLDPVTYVSASGLLAGVALLACLVPAWTAASLDPARILRAE